MDYGLLAGEGDEQEAWRVIWQVHKLACGSLPHAWPCLGLPEVLSMDCM
jgi:hypothetical protein